jgi:hypothetical protein
MKTEGNKIEVSAISKVSQSNCRDTRSMSSAAIIMVGKVERQFCSGNTATVATACRT